MLSIQNLHVAVQGTEILKGLSLEVPAGEVHAIMGPNGAGKSTLSYVLTGRDGYEVTEGSATLDGEDLLALAPDERAARGLFLSFQYPLEIPGVPALTFLRTALNAQKKARGEADDVGRLRAAFPTVHEHGEPARVRLRALAREERLQAHAVAAVEQVFDGAFVDCAAIVAQQPAAQAGGSEHRLHVAVAQPARRSERRGAQQFAVVHRRSGLRHGDRCRVSHRHSRARR